MLPKFCSLLRSFYQRWVFGDWIGNAVDRFIDLPLGGFGITALFMWWMVQLIPSLVDVWLNKTKDKLFYRTREQLRRQDRQLSQINLNKAVAPCFCCNVFNENY